MTRAARVTSDDGKTYEVTDKGTLKETTDRSGGIVGGLVGCFESVVKGAVDAVTPSTTRK